MNRVAMLAAAALSVSASTPPALPPSVAGLDGNFDESRVPAFTLPDPLLLAGGQRVKDRGTWERERRPELVRLFEQNVYGVSPSVPQGMRFVVTEEDHHALGGLATRRQVQIYLNGQVNGPQIALLLYVPNNRRGRAPMFLGLNFHGNQAIAADPAIAITPNWVVPAAGILKGRATFRSRGIDAAEWPVERLVRAGYGVATIFSGDVYPDNDDGVVGSVQPFYGTSPSDPHHWGALATWAWALSRAYDYLATDADVDPRKVIVFGHSRYGKAALWAGARDQRFAAVISNDSGEGGAALFRRQFGETIRVMNNYWFCPEMKTFVGREQNLPLDQHELIALVAPRPVYVATASDDLWADPHGEFIAARAAEPVYHLYAQRGLGTDRMPAADHPIGARIRFHMRTGVHEITDYDWTQYIRFADQELGSEASHSPAS